MNDQFDFIVLGAGSAGVRAARFAAGFGAKVAIVEAGALGGTCVNVGCIPKKLYVYASEFPADTYDARFYGWEMDEPTIEFRRLVENKDREIERLNGIYQGLLERSGATIVRGFGRLLDEERVAVGERVLHGKKILLATGGRPTRLDLPGSELGIDSNGFFAMKTLPRSIVIVGGGYIAVELAMILASFGVKTKLAFRRKQILRGFDSDLREALTAELLRQGIELYPNSEFTGFARAGDQLAVELRSGSIVADEILHATGRKPLLEDIGLENTRVQLGESGFIRVNEHFQTHAPSIYAAGDIIGGAQLTPVALAEGMHIARHLFDGKTEAPDLKNVPTAVFTSPSIGTVGLSEEDARAHYPNVVIYRSSFRALKLTLTDRQERTLVKLVVDGQSDRVLGCHVLGEGAGEIIQGFAVALRAGATKAVFDSTIGIHPTIAEELVTLREPIS